jgi:hypothetical protein
VFFRVRRSARFVRCCQLPRRSSRCCPGVRPIASPPRLRPWASRPGPCRHPGTAAWTIEIIRRAPLVNFTSPAESSDHPPGRPLTAPSRVGRPRPTSSLEVSRPSSARGAWRPVLAAVADRHLPTSPFLTTSPVCSALDPPEFSPGGAHGVSSLQGFSRSHRATSPLPVLPFPHGLRRRAAPPWRAPPLRGAASPRCVGGPSGPHSMSRPSPLTSGFPSARVRSPLGFAFWDLAPGDGLTARLPPTKAGFGQLARPPTVSRWLPGFPRTSTGRSAPSRFPI